MTQTAEWYQRSSDGTVRRAIEVLGDVHAPARAWAVQYGREPNVEADVFFTVGYLTGTIRGLLDALGFPEQGPNVDQHSWLPNDDEEEGS